MKFIWFKVFFPGIQIIYLTASNALDISRSRRNIVLSDALMAFLLFIPTLKEKHVSESSC